MSLKAIEHQDDPKLWSKEEN